MHNIEREKMKMSRVKDWMRAAPQIEIIEQMSKHYLRNFSNVYDLKRLMDAYITTPTPDCRSVIEQLAADIASDYRGTFGQQPPWENKND